MTKLLSMFNTPSATQLAARELAQAQRSLLDAQSAYEYAKRMSEYHSDRIRRLTTFLQAA